MKVLLEIPDKDATFGIKVLKSLSFIIEAKPLSAATAKLWDDLKETAEEVRLHKCGKSINGFLLNLMSAIAAYSFFPKKPSIKKAIEETNLLAIAHFNMPQLIAA